jgi:triacylglycerol esterase/lipase EstA (alpha/beta hydrolase family)
MTAIMRRWHVVSTAALLLALLSFSDLSLANRQQPPSPEILPTIFVHGSAGSAAQYQSQAMRFASNGVPDEMILAFEYNTGAAAGIAAAPAALDALVDQVRTRFAVERVNLVALAL